MCRLKMDEDFILRNLLHQQEQGLAQVGTYRQLSLFDDGSIFGQPGSHRNASELMVSRDGINKEMVK